MKITIIGGTGWLGNAVAAEALERGHEAVAVSRNPKDILYTQTPEILSLYADAKDVEALKYAVPEDTEVLVNALIPDPFMHDTFLGWVENVMQCCKEKHIPRLIALTDSCVFEVRPGLKLNETTFLTPFYRTWFGMHEFSHELYLKETELDWVEMAPAAKCLPDLKTKAYRIAVDRLCTNDPEVAALRTKDPDHYPFGDTSYISIEDFAYAVVDEIERPQFHRKRICVAWQQNHRMYAEEECV